MKLIERIEYLSYIFESLCETNSTLEKRQIVEDVDEKVKDDFEYCVKVLTGEIKFGYTYKINSNVFGTSLPENTTVTDVFEYLRRPLLQGDLSELNIMMHIAPTAPFAYFFAPIINRTLKIGIGKSILPTDGLSAMLAKKFDVDKISDASNCGYYITEKLDGNRCIARFNGEKWVYTSRNGKVMNVQFDMKGLPKEFVYDGEILSPHQTKVSTDIAAGIVTEYGNTFNSTSGLINTHSLDKKLVYNIFDIMIDDCKYYERRKQLDMLVPKSDNVRILPVLLHVHDYNTLIDESLTLLNIITNYGAEGLMINIGNRIYEHKRTDSLLKLKKVQTIDMKVVDVLDGTGKYEGMVGALVVNIVTTDGKDITCNVGSGLSDQQREEWTYHPENIIGKIVEIAYFSTSQSKNNTGTNIYSLRFPRLKRVRFDKVKPSEF